MQELDAAEQGRQELVDQPRLQAAQYVTSCDMSISVFGSLAMYDRSFFFQK